MKAVLVGKKEIKTKDSRKFTIAYLLFDEKETIGQACKDAFIDGHNLSDSMVGAEVNVEIDFKGRVTDVTAA